MKSQSYTNFWQRIHRAAKTKGFPLRVMFELTYRCNFKCKHCYVPLSYRKKEELKTKEIFSILEQLRDIGCFYLGLTGGEPFMRKDIIDILRYARKKGFEIMIYTNGSLINGKIAQELQQFRPNKVDITIPAMSRGAFEQITRMSGSHKKVFSAIDLLHKKGVSLGFKTCVLKENEFEIKDIQDFAASLGALHRLDNMLSPRLDGSKEPYRYRGVLEETLHATRFTPHASRHTPHADCVSKNQLPITKDIFRCGVGVSQAAITPQGELKMCLMIDYPKYKIVPVSRCTLHAPRSKPDASLQEDADFLRGACSLRREAYSLKEAWGKLKELVSSIKPNENYQGDRCKLEPYCKWCPAQAWLENKSFTAYDPESRRWAEIRSQKSKERSGIYLC